MLTNPRSLRYYPLTIQIITAAYPQLMKGIKPVEHLATKLYNPQLNLEEPKTDVCINPRQ
jgi:hypothetical protein